MRTLLLILGLLILSGCTPPDAGRIVDYRTLGELRVATRQDPVSYRIDETGAASGFEHDLLVRLGERLGVPVRFDVYPDSAAALDAVVSGQAHLAAAGLGRNDRLPLLWSAPLREVEYVLVGRSDRPEINDESDLAGRTITARRGSPITEALQRLRKRIPELKLHFTTGRSGDQLLAGLARGDLDIVATDSVQYAIAAQTAPELVVVDDLPVRSTISWALSHEAHDDLAREVAAFVAEATVTELLARIADRYFGHVRRLNDTDVTTFLARTRARLPRFRDFFQEAQARTGIDWRFLAALAYQESQWDPLATSWSGVRGIMMLTSDTADRLGVNDRLDPRASILGGARYFLMLRDQLADSIPEPDRSWMAAAAYNLGMGHLNGARQIASRIGKDNTSWLDMKAVLPLMSKPEYASRLKAGAARGGEAVIMAENIRNYHDILMRLEPAFAPPLQPLGLKLGTVAKPLGAGS
ncbi:MAG TPA: membrane-bound lytic murein transglycosylase MltF [Aromatoleum sp.]|uniref:membrane-bound lytic murein transglycosylase MltF n=1 Tax=Aromatoleum sp. TaxID=2307007 RepID=UPI002B4641F3|nr:membrane-bound lytic murein transglycosylase MltF [Aromatoleum sp.]HJV28731.1 membrane-bound lytic murein transglycosylase MltF [Aromatoleum sp.]